MVPCVVPCMVPRVRIRCVGAMLRRGQRARTATRGTMSDTYIRLVSRFQAAHLWVIDVACVRRRRCASGIWRVAAETPRGRLPADQPKRTKVRANSAQRTATHARTSQFSSLFHEWPRLSMSSVFTCSVCGPLARARGAHCPSRSSRTASNVRNLLGVIGCIS